MVAQQTQIKVQTFLIIDKKEVYHIGASLKDLGKRWFAFSKMEPEGLGLLDKLP